MRETTNGSIALLLCLLVLIFSGQVTSLVFELRQNGSAQAIDGALLVVASSFSSNQSATFSSCLSAIRQGRAFAGGSKLSNGFGSPACNVLFQPGAPAISNTRSFWLPNSNNNNNTSVSNTSYFDSSFKPFTTSESGLWIAHIRIPLELTGDGNKLSLTVATQSGSTAVSDSGSVAVVTKFAVNGTVIEAQCATGTRNQASCTFDFAPQSVHVIADIFIMTISESSPAPSLELQTSGRIDPTIDSSYQIASTWPTTTTSPQMNVEQGSNVTFRVTAFDSLEASKELVMEISRSPTFGQLYGDAATNVKRFPLNSTFIYKPATDIHTVQPFWQDAASFILVNTTTNQTLLFGGRVVFKIQGQQQPPQFTQNISIPVQVGIIYQSNRNMGNGWVSDQDPSNPDYNPSTNPELVRLAETLQIVGQLTAMDPDTPLTQLRYKSVDMNGSLFVTNATSSSASTAECRPQFLNENSSGQSIKEVWSSIGQMKDCKWIGMNVTEQGLFFVNVPRFFVLPKQKQSTEQTMEALRRELQSLQFKFFTEVTDGNFTTSGSVEIVLQPFIYANLDGSLPGGIIPGQNANGEDQTISPLAIVLAVLGVLILLVATIIGFIFMFRRNGQSLREEEGDGNRRGRGSQVKRMSSTLLNSSRSGASSDFINNQIDEFDTRTEKNLSENEDLESFRDARDSSRSWLPDFLDPLPGNERWNPLYMGRTPTPSRRSSSALRRQSSQLTSSPILQPLDLAHPVVIVEKPKGLRRHSSIHPQVYSVVKE